MLKAFVILVIAFLVTGAVLEIYKTWIGWKRASSIINVTEGLNEFVGRLFWLDPKKDIYYSKIGDEGISRQMLKDFIKDVQKKLL